VPDWKFNILLLLFSMVLAIASYHFIEKPFRYPRIIREKRVLVVSSFAIFMGLSYRKRQ